MKDLNSNVIRGTNWLRKIRDSFKDSCRSKRKIRKWIGHILIMIEEGHHQQHTIKKVRDKSTELESNRRNRITIQPGNLKCKKMTPKEDKPKNTIGWEIKVSTSSVSKEINS